MAEEESMDAEDPEERLVARAQEENAEQAKNSSRLLCAKSTNLT